jgi:hypothetical protein
MPELQAMKTNQNGPLSPVTVLWCLEGYALLTSNDKNNGVWDRNVNIYTEELEIDTPFLLN